MRTAEELRALVEGHLGGLALHATPEAPGLAEAMRYPVETGGKRLRPVLCLAVGEAVGAEVEHLLAAAAAVELVHTFSLVHDDLPALDDDPIRRGSPSAHVRFGEAVAILAGDALLAQAFELTASYDTPQATRELARATIGMIGGQYLDVTGEDVELRELHRLKTGRLFGAAVGCALAVARVPPEEQLAWREFADHFGLLFQLADDLADGDGSVDELGHDATRALAAVEAENARAALARAHANTEVVQELLAELARYAA
ncbi:MAG: polyprenyl synthetase family protein [Gaiellaceae bacterium]